MAVRNKPVRMRHRSVALILRTVATVLMLGAGVIPCAGVSPCGAQNLPPPGAYQPIPNFTGAGAGLQFREAINNRFSGAQPIAPRLATIAAAQLAATPAINGGLLYCIDCQTNTSCSPGGTGTIAMAEAGAWTCGGSGGSGGLSSVSNGTNVTGALSSGGVALTLGWTGNLATSQGGTSCGAAGSFSALPASPVLGTICTVTDAQSCVVGTPVTGGGYTTKCQVTWNGANWVPAGGAAGTTIPNAVLYATNYPGSTFDVQVNACLAALPSGGGTCDARGLTGAQTGAASITVPTGATLLLGSPLGLTMASGGQILMPNDSGTLVCPNYRTVISGHVSGDAVVKMTGNSTKLYNCGVQNTDTTDAASSDVSFSGINTILSTVETLDGYYGLDIHGGYYSEVDNLINYDASGAQKYQVHMDSANQINFLNPTFSGAVTAEVDIENSRAIHMQGIDCEATNAADCFDLNFTDTAGETFLYVDGGYVQLNGGGGYINNTAGVNNVAYVNESHLYVFNQGSGICHSNGSVRLNGIIGGQPDGSLSIGSMSDCIVESYGSPEGGFGETQTGLNASSWWADTNNNPGHTFGIRPADTGLWNFQRDDGNVAGTKLDIVGSLQAEGVAANGAGTVCADASGNLFTIQSGSCPTSTPSASAKPKTASTVRTLTPPANDSMTGQ